MIFAGSKRCAQIAEILTLLTFEDKSLFLRFWSYFFSSISVTVKKQRQQQKEQNIMWHEIIESDREIWIGCSTQDKLGTTPMIK